MCPPVRILSGAHGLAVCLGCNRQNAAFIVKMQWFVKKAKHFKS